MERPSGDDVEFEANGSEPPPHARSEPEAARTLRPSVLVALVATLAAAVFSPALMAGFVYDDIHLVENNAMIRSFSHWGYWFTHHLWDTGGDASPVGDALRYWRPSITASYAIDWSLGNGNPVVFHVTNLAWHAAATVLVLRALVRWTGAVGPAALGALLFALHPTKAESVAWVSGRTDVFCMVAILAVCELDVHRRSTSSHRWVWLGLQVVATAFAYTLKEQAVVIPVLLAVEAWAERGRGAVDRGAIAAMLRRSLPQAAVAVAYLVVRAVVMPLSLPATLTASERAQLFFESMGRYAAVTFAPHDLSLQRALLATQSGRLVFSSSHVLLGVGFVLIVLSAMWFTRRRAPGVAVGLALFVALLLPTSNLVPALLHTMVSERFLYAPLLGLALAMAWALAALPLARRKLGSALAVACVAVCGVLASQRAADFVDEDTFWQREYRLHPESFDAMLYFIDRDQEAGDLPSALGWAARGATTSAKHHRHLGMDAKFVVSAAKILLRVTPDRDLAALRTLDAFFDELATRRSGSTRLQTNFIDLTLELSSPPVQRRLDQHRSRLLAFRAEIASRLGDDAAATDLANQATGMCPGCAEVGAFAAMAHARASRYPEAEAVLDGVARRSSESRVENTRRTLRRARALATEAASAPEGAPRLQLRAQELTTLEAWGRAYAVLLPHRAAIEQAPGVALGFAELAYRAGDRTVANEVLNRVAPSESHAELQAAWARRMGWSSPISTPQRASP